MRREARIQTGPDDAVDCRGDHAMGRRRHLLIAVDLGFDVRLQRAATSWRSGDGNPVCPGRRRRAARLAGTDARLSSLRRCRKRAWLDCFPGRRLAFTPVEGYYVQALAWRSRWISGEERRLSRAGLLHRRKLRSVVAHHYRGGERIGARIAGRGRNHNSAQSPPAAQAAMIVLTISETAMLAAHLFFFIPYMCFAPRLRHNLCRATVAI